MGLAVLVLVGTGLGLAGVDTGHRAGLVIWLAVTAAGWIAAVWVWGSGPILEDKRRFRKREPDPEPPPNGEPSDQPAPPRRRWLPRRAPTPAPEPTTPD
jgi:hypothetical protein